MSRLLVLLAVSVTSLVTYGTGAAVADSVFLGQVGHLGLSGTCVDCSAVQLTDTGPASGVPESGGYTAPFSGVLTYFGYRAGAEITTSPADSVRPQVFSVVGGTATVNHQGVAHVIQPWPGAPPLSGGTRYFRDRVPVAAGELLGGRFTVKNIAVNGDPTPPVFTTTASGDKSAVGVPGSSLGDSFTATPQSSLRVNLLATLEPDADQDSYGDISQDLCPGSPIGGGSCSGALFGSRLQSEVEPDGFCGGECLLLQKTIGGISQAAPFAGVVVRWRVLDADTGSYRVRTVSASEPNEFYRVGPSSAVGNVVASSPIRPMKKAITSFPTRIPIEAGGYVGLVYQASAHRSLGAGSSGATYQQLANAVPDGTVERGLISPFTGELLYDADIEPDADHDGYGDVTQDSCPGTATVHDGACPVIDVFPPPVTPKITGLEVVPKKFRVKAKGNSARLKLTLSREATVAFGIEAKKTCGGKGKGKKARCKPGFHSVQTITRKLAAGQDAVPYSARLRRSGKEVPLSPGSYRVTAMPTAGSLTGKVARAAFAVLPPRHGTGR